MGITFSATEKIESESIFEKMEKYDKELEHDKTLRKGVGELHGTINWYTNALFSFSLAFVLLYLYATSTEDSISEFIIDRWYFLSLILLCGPTAWYYGVGINQYIQNKRLAILNKKIKVLEKEQKQVIKQFKANTQYDSIRKLLDKYESPVKVPGFRMRTPIKNPSAVKSKEKTPDSRGYRDKDIEIRLKKLGDILFQDQKPEDKFALICKACNKHNGMSTKADTDFNCLYCEISNMTKHSSRDDDFHTDRHSLASLTTPLRPRNPKLLLKNALRSKNTPELEIFSNKKTTKSSPLSKSSHTNVAANGFNSNSSKAYPHRLVFDKENSRPRIE